MDARDLPPDRAELLRIVDRVRIELVYTRSALRNFVPLRNAMSEEDRAEFLNLTGAVVSRCNDTISEVEKLIAEIK
jgi:hypothetical protein